MTLRVGLAGAGYWASLQHAPMHAKARGTELVGIWAREPDLRETLAVEHGVPAFDSFDELLANCDAVDFAIPPAAQAELGVRAAQAGKHLLLEKPIAGDLEAASRLAQAVERAGVKSVVSLTRRFHPRTEEFITNVRALAAQGEVLGAQGTFLHGGLLPGGFLQQGTWRSATTGPLLDLGAHIIDIAMAAIGPVRSVRASGGRYSTLELTHDSGAVTQLAVSMHVHAMPSVHELDVFGTAGFAHYDKVGILDSDCWMEICNQLADAAERDAPVAVDVSGALELQRVLSAAEEAMATSSVVPLAGRGD